MNGTTSLPMSDVPRRRGGIANTLAWFRVSALPLLTNFWPLLLFVSQKAFVPPALVLAGFGDKAYRRDLVFAGVAILVGLLLFLLQNDNPYSSAHFIGFALFAASMPLINNAVRADPAKLVRFLTYLTVFNALMGFFLLYANIDLYGLRGLNRVVGSDGMTHRVYFESSSLAAVATLSAFRPRWAKIASIIVIMAYTIFVAKSTVIILLLLINFAYPAFMKTLPVLKVVTILAALFFGILLAIYLPVLRPDIYLSLYAKEFQFAIITDSIEDGWTALGWGAYFPPLSSDPEQPYQIEMQLPMLFVQLGPITVLAILGLLLALFRSATNNSMKALARFCIYAVIGFNNPWLFVPSWYLTCQLLFRYDDNNA